MSISEKIVVNKDKLEKIQTKLRGLKVMVHDKETQLLVTDILELLDGELKENDNSVEDMIYNKMNETKNSNPDLHFRLYMLYRKLSDGKIGEDEALKAYKTYISM
ncbi:hypothetical protein GKZ28_27505 [Clostridium chromiireducens]|uniref:Uncharacterized protein n=1 Tax=Clostridium chromiireducens TaxID=225345 RepID=A0A964RTF3_9CLOT|nr:hypothetical protein [Clostridium chromiireducens]MVX67370.1 hypothetical protein [Clostridium chromiireducens]